MIILVNQEINEFLSANALYIALGFIGLLVIVTGGIMCFNIFRKRKIPCRKELIYGYR